MCGHRQQYSITQDTGGQECQLTHPEDDVVAEHQVFVAAADLSILIPVVVHLRGEQTAVTHTHTVHTLTLHTQSVAQLGC